MICTGKYGRSVDLMGRDGISCHSLINRDQASNRVECYPIGYSLCRNLHVCYKKLYTTSDSVVSAKKRRTNEAEIRQTHKQQAFSFKKNMRSPP